MSECDRFTTNNKRIVKMTRTWVVEVDKPTDEKLLPFSAVDVEAAASLCEATTGSWEYLGTDPTALDSSNWAALRIWRQHAEGGSGD